jgi:hypothetical protein
MLISVYADSPNVLAIELRGINYRYINGRIKNKKFCAGYCDCSLHSGALTEKMIRQHQCNEKECSRLYHFIDEAKIWGS